MKPRKFKVIVSKSDGTFIDKKSMHVDYPQLFPTTMKHKHFDVDWNLYELVDVFLIRYDEIKAIRLK